MTRDDLVHREQDVPVSLCAGHSKAQVLCTEMPMFKRLIVVLLAYLLSAGGLLMMVGLIAESLQEPRGINAISMVWLAAWFMHAVMSIAWIRDIRLSRVWPVAGLVTGIGSFLVWPLVAVKQSSLSGMDGVAVSATGTLMAVQVVLVAPSLLLAIWLVRFHWNKTASNVQSAIDAVP